MPWIKGLSKPETKDSYLCTYSLYSCSAILNYSISYFYTDACVKKQSEYLRPKKGRAKIPPQVTLSPFLERSTQRKSLLVVTKE